MSLTRGTRLGAYEILARLGAGGMEEVYRARDTKLGREVALKIYAVSKEGQRFLIARPASTSMDPPAPSQITVVLNWTAALRK